MSTFWLKTSMEPENDRYGKAAYVKNEIYKMEYLFLLTAVFVVSLCGCSRKYNPKDPALLESVYMASMYDEVNGYHVPGLTWDMRKAEVEETICASLGKASEGLEKTYYIENSDIEKVDGKVTSTVDYAFSAQGTLVNVTYNFYAEDYTSEELDELFERVKEEFSQYYGESNSVNESRVEQGKIIFFITTAKWEKKMSDGQVTSLQVAKADRGEETEVVSVGATIYSEEKADGK